MNRKRVFISYSHKDRAWLEALQTHLRPLEREGRVTRWDDTLIQSGSQWRQAIKSALDEARIAVLLVSKHYLESDFIADNELPQLLRAAESGGALILPVLVGPCRFSRTPGLARFQAVNSPDETLAEMTEAQQDRVWLRLVERIEDELAAAGTKRQDLSQSLERATDATCAGGLPDWSGRRLPKRRGEVEQVVGGEGPTRRYHRHRVSRAAVRPASTPTTGREP